MSSTETVTVNPDALDPNAKARYFYAKRMFQAADDSAYPDSQVLVDQHEQWLRNSLGKIGINALMDNLYVIFRDGKLPNKKNKPEFRKIEKQVMASTFNILQGLLWYTAPEYASWKHLALVAKSSGLIDNQEEATNHMLSRKKEIRWRDEYKSLIVGYKPNTNSPDSAIFELSVNEHYDGIQGRFDYVNSKRSFIGVDCEFDPEKRLFTFSFKGNPNFISDFIGWDQPKEEAPVYRLTYARNLIRDLYSKLKSGSENVIRLSKWRAY